MTPYRATTEHDGAGSIGQPARVRVAIADEQPLLLDGLARALDGPTGMRVVVQATSGAELLRRLDEVPVDVVLIEPWMRDGEGLDAISGLTTRFPGMPIIALSGVADPGHVQQAVALGVSAYVGKGTRANDLPSIVRHVFLDDEETLEAVRRKLAETEAVARRQGFVVAIGHPHDSTLQALAEWLPTVQGKGLALAPSTAILRKRNGWD